MGFFLKSPTTLEIPPSSINLTVWSCRTPHPLKISISSLRGVGILYGTAQHEEWEGTRNDNMMSTSGLGGVILKFRKRVLPASFMLLINN